MGNVKKVSISSLCILGLLMLGCLDPFEPPTSNKKIDWLVIDGTINSTDNVAKVKISRAVNLSESSAYPLETSATVSIEVENHKPISLSESTPGVYSAKQVFDTKQRYRLRVKAKEKEYLSDYIKLEKNSSIDSLTWKADNSRLEIMANTHDFSEGHKYYRYTFEETHEYTSVVFSAYQLINGAAVYRTPDNYIFWCWITKPSKSILLTSTENLTQKVVSQFPITRIERGDRRLWIKYSVLVQQISLSKEAYDYWTQLQKTSESLGSLFDPLPYEIKGNIKSISDPSETVLGYFSGGEVAQKRLVISNRIMPDGYAGVLKGDCEEDNVKLGLMHTLNPKFVMLIRPELDGITVVGYFYTTHSCTDCRLEGGTTLKPDFMN